MKSKETGCYKCGACCIAYSISSLNKPAGIRCKNLLDNGKCDDYDNRPQVCRDFKADNLCALLKPLPLEEKLKIIKEVYDL